MMTETIGKIQFEKPRKEIKVTEPTMFLNYVGSVRRFREWMKVLAEMSKQDKK